VKHYHRSKIIVIKASTWNQLIDVSDDSEVSTTTQWPNGNEFEQKALTHAQSGYVVGVSNMRLWRDGGGGSAGHIGNQGGSRGSQDISVTYENADNRSSQTGIYCVDELGGSVTLTQNAGYRFGDVDTITDYRDLIIWEMRLAGAGGDGVANVTDTAGASDSATASKAGDFPRSTTDNATAADSITAQLGAARPVTDNTTAADAPTRATAATRPTTDNATATDSADALTVVTPDVTDNVTASDSTTRTTVAARSTTDDTTAADSVTAVKGVAGYVANVTDSVDASDSTTMAQVLNRAVQDILAVSDAVNKDLDRRIADAVGATDSATVSLTTVSQVTDNATAADSVTAQYTFDRTVSDSVGASESINRVGVYARSDTDDAAAVDDFLAQLGGEGIDSLTVTSTISTTAALTSTIYETGGS
jgi:hypothetical protein